jgi:hypothetical protein
MTLQELLGLVRMARQRAEQAVMSLERAERLLEDSQPLQADVDGVSKRDVVSMHLTLAATDVSVLRARVDQAAAGITSVPDADPVHAVAASSVMCPRCKRFWAWLGEQGQSVQLNGRCLVCALIDESCSEEERERLFATAVRGREAAEAHTGRRVFPCIACSSTGGDDEVRCTRCGGRGWVLGYPPGAGHRAPS